MMKFCDADQADPQKLTPFRHAVCAFTHVAEADVVMHFLQHGPIAGHTNVQTAEVLQNLACWVSGRDSDWNWRSVRSMPTDSLEIR